MRLTLRTLLTYLDNVLEEPARSELKQQIDSSEHASEWVHRMRDVTRRLKLGAPEVDGSGPSDDPNVVAEYLDRTLADEGVAEFERVCLDSDAMLSEIVSCHHVLAMVLNEQPAIDPDTKRRLHNLQSELSEALRSHAEVAPPKTSEVSEYEVEPEVTETAYETPEYLRTSDRNEWLRWAPAIAALLLLALTAIVAFRSGALSNSAEDEDQVAALDLERAAAVSEPESTDALEQETPQSTEEQEQPSEIDPDAQELAADTPGEDETSAEEQPPSETPDSQEQSSAEDLLADDPAEAPTEVDETTPEVEAVEPEVIVEAAPEPPAPPQYLGSADSLVITQAEPGVWRRLLTEEQLTSESRVVVPTNYRARFALSDGFSAEVVGPSEVIVSPATVDRTAAIELLQGRLLLTTDQEAAESGRVQVIVDEVPHDATLDPGAALALEMDRFYKPGWPVSQTESPASAVANALGGSMEWTSPGEESRIARPRRWYLAGPDDTAPAGFGDPSWAESEEQVDFVQQVAMEVAEQLPAEGDVLAQLIQIAREDEFRERRALAAAAACMLHEPRPLLSTLNDPEQYRDWRKNLDLLRHHASRSTQIAQMVQSVVVNRFQTDPESEAPAAEASDEANRFMSLLTGFEPEEFGQTPDQIASGVLVEAILPALQSEDLATRVLGSLVLDDLAEPMERPYSPIDVRRRRLSATRRLESMIERGEVIPRNPD